MTTSRTTTTIQPNASTSSRPADPPSPSANINEEEDLIMREALARVERVKARKAAEAAKKKAEAEAAARKAAEEAEERKKAVTETVAARRQAAQDARDRAARAQEQEDGVVERRRKLAGAAAARSQGGTSTGEASVSPRRPIVEIPTVKGKGKARALPVGEDPDDGDDGNDDDEDEEDREPCERCKVKKIPCQKQAGKRSSVICKPCHDSKVRCSYSGRPYTIKKEGGASPSGERLAVLESQMAQVLANNRALRESASRSHQYLRQLLRRQDEDHSRLIAIDIRLGSTGAILAAPGPSRVVIERPRSLKRRGIVENSNEEEEEEKGEEMEKEKEVEKEKRMKRRRRRRDRRRGKKEQTLLYIYFFF
ncbi:hypothetical protein EV359DRAFT_88055 [Lentinula novae-zelandiae]|nr:hypothetical protein EV359DRAFT_88055 [Lentinula novae-zelandiae]